MPCPNYQTTRGNTPWQAIVRAEPRVNLVTIMGNTPWQAIVRAEPWVNLVTITTGKTSSGLVERT